MADSQYMVGNALDSVMAGQKFKQDMETQDLQNQMNQARLPGIVGQSQTLAAQGQVDQETLPQTIAAQRSKLMGQMSDSDAKQMTNMGGQIAQFGSMLDSMPGPARMAAITQFASKFGMDANSPLIQGLAKTDPDKLPEIVKTMGTNMVQTSADYLKNQGLLQQKGVNAANTQQLKNQGAAEVANIKGGYSVDVANLNNASRENLAKFQAELRQQLQDTKAKSPGQYLAARLAEYQANPNDPDAKQRLDQAYQVVQGVSQNPALMKMFQEATVANNVLGNTAPNTIPQPNANPVAGFPTGPGAGGGVTQQAAPQASGLPPGAKQIGTSRGKPVYQLPDGRQVIQQ